LYKIYEIRRVQAGKAASLPSDWFLLVDPINHVQTFDKQTSCFLRSEHSHW